MGEMRREKSVRDGAQDHLRLFETKEPKGVRRVVYRLFAVSIFVGICFIWIYRVTHILNTWADEEEESAAARGAPKWIWIGLFLAELWFGLYWILTQAVRWKNVYRCTFKERFSQRYGDKDLPGVDIFVFTADPIIEPPTLVINTVLSVMAYDYPPEKLNVYLSDDGGSDLTFYALLEASCFAKHWRPFCKKFKVEPRSPAAYFAQRPQNGSVDQREWLGTKGLYEDMIKRIETMIKLGTVSEVVKEQHRGFLEWDSKVSKRDHQTILQILIDGRDPNAVDSEGNVLPTLVYLAREKRPKYPHNFKAGAVNALIRVSSEISNGSVIVSVDCDMYSNDSKALRDALCFLMDEEEGNDIAFVQCPQSFDNLTKGDLYASSYKVITEVELRGVDGYGGAIYSGTGCFHRRESLSGRKYTKDYREDWNRGIESSKAKRSLNEVEEAAKVLADCTFEKNTQWGNEMGLKYGCPVEDVITGLAIQCRGWRSVFYNPENKCFMGVAPVTLNDALVQYKRWSEGLFQIFLSRYCPFIFGYGKLKLGLQMGYCVYALWAPCSFPVLYYVFVPSFCFLSSISLFPKMSSAWFLPFAYVFMATNLYSIYEALAAGETLGVWWNVHRIWLYRRITAFFFSFIDTVIRQLGFTQTTFVITSKVVDKDVYKRYENEIMEFGTSSPMFAIISTVALFNLFSLLGGLRRAIMDNGTSVIEVFISQIIICGLVVLLNKPVYEAMFRSDKGRMPLSITFISFVVASLACFCTM